MTAEQMVQYAYEEGFSAAVVDESLMGYTNL